MKTFRYEGEYAREVSMPMGGIGAGCVGLAGNGGFMDWEVDGQGKGVLNHFTHFALRAKTESGVVAKVLQGDHIRDLTGSYQRERTRHHVGFGYGPNSGTLAGFPHFENCVFEGAFPWAQLTFRDSELPCEARLSAWSSFIPMNADDSSLPCAFFELAVTNTAAENVEYTAAFTLGCLFESALNTALPNGLAISGGENGMCVITDAPEAHVQESWFRGAWFDGPTCYWNEFSSGKPLLERSYDTPGTQPGTVEVPFVLTPGETRTVKFVMAWYYPTQLNYWEAGEPTCWKKWYATKFDSAEAVASYAMDSFERLKQATFQFRDALYSCDVPEFVLDAAGSSLSTLVTPVCLRLTDGSFWAWEGSQELMGSCPGTCQHVWNYAYALPYLFPELEMSVRRMERDFSQWEDGRITFRLKLPAGSGKGWEMPCVDGQMGYILKIYREWKFSGDKTWLQEMYPSAKKALEFAWLDTDVKWDADKDGIIDGRQHHTLDMELFGANSWLEGFYLAALKAMAEMAAYLGEDAGEYLRLFENGKKYLNTQLFNGEYYHQIIALTDKRRVERFGEAAVKSYWNEESGEIKYQIGEGLIIDQCLAQWHADLMGLGEIFEKDKLSIALDSLYKYNFKPEMRKFWNPCRVFSLNGEAGTVMCEYPECAVKPAIPVPYCQETMTGFEYAAAGLMLQQGKRAEAEAMIRAVRDRYDGKKRNPYNEIECGNNYSRAMAAFAFLPIYSGYSCDAVKGEMGFAPMYGTTTIWAMGGAWGTASIGGAETVIKAAHGVLNLSALSLPKEAVQVEVDGKAVDFAWENGRIVFAQPIASGKKICVTHK